MLGPGDVGHRVVVRRVVGVRDDRPLFSDALGELTELTDSHLVIATERGPLRIPLPLVTRAKRIPPRRIPRGQPPADAAPSPRHPVRTDPSPAHTDPGEPDHIDPSEIESPRHPVQAGPSPAQADTGQLGSPRQPARSDPSADHPDHPDPDQT